MAEDGIIPPPEADPHERRYRHNPERVQAMIQSWMDRGMIVPARERPSFLDGDPVPIDFRRLNDMCAYNVHFSLREHIPTPAINFDVAPNVDEPPIRPVPNRVQALQAECFGCHKVKPVYNGFVKRSFSTQARFTDFLCKECSDVKLV